MILDFSIIMVLSFSPDRSAVVVAGVIGGVVGVVLGAVVLSVCIIICIMLAVESSSPFLTHDHIEDRAGSSS